MDKNWLFPVNSLKLFQYMNVTDIHAFKRSNSKIQALQKFLSEQGIGHYIAIMLACISLLLFINILINATLPLQPRSRAMRFLFFVTLKEKLIARKINTYSEAISGVQSSLKPLLAKSYLFVLKSELKVETIAYCLREGIFKKNNLWVLFHFQSTTHHRVRLFH